jgi:chromosome segregation ATPase
MGGKFMSQDFYQENDLWQALQAETEPFQQHQQLVEMARLLLERANSIEHDFTQLVPDDLTGLLIEYKGTALQVNTFFQKSLPHIDPEYKGEPFEQKLQTLQQTLSETCKEIERIREQNTMMSEQQAQLDKKIDTLTQLKPQIETLEDNISQLKTQLEQLKPHQEHFEQLANKSEQLNQEVITSIIESIPNIVALIKTNQEIYQNHFVVNAQTGEAMQHIEEKTSEIATHTDKIATLSKDISASLQDFDRELQHLIEIGDKQGANL